VVKQVVYVTDIRYQTDVGKCQREACRLIGERLLVINGLAIRACCSDRRHRGGCRKVGL
jgi:hypothetical protein